MQFLQYPMELGTRVAAKRRGELRMGVASSLVRVPLNETVMRASSMVFTYADLGFISLTGRTFDFLGSEKLAGDRLRKRGDQRHAARL